MNIALERSSWGVPEFWNVKIKMALETTERTRNKIRTKNKNFWKLSIIKFLKFGKMSRIFKNNSSNQHHLRYQHPKINIHWPYLDVQLSKPSCSISWRSQVWPVDQCWSLSTWFLPPKGQYARCTTRFLCSSPCLQSSLWSVKNP